MILGLLTGLSVTAAAVLALLAIQVWRRREAAAGLSLAVLLLSAAWWAVAYSLELSSRTLEARGNWGDLKYFGICLVAPSWLVFVLQYTGRGHLVTRRRLRLLAVEPLAVWMVLALPVTHDLVRYYLPRTLDDQIPVVSVGPVFWVNLIYGYAMILVALVVFVHSMARLSREYRVAAVVMVAAAVLPWLANMLHNLEVPPFERIDLTPFLFSLGGGVLVWGLFRQRLVNLSSVAWRLVVATMPDVVILRDAFGRISDINPAGVAALRRPRADLVGRDLDQALGIPLRLPDAPDTNDERDTSDEQDMEISLNIDGATRFFDVRQLPLPHPDGSRSSELIILRDVTARRESETKLRNLLQERTRIAATLQASLRPPPLPTVPGCELAAHYEAAGTGHEVGGDFYDVFPLGPRDWGVVLGDVSGKGTEAAALTSLIRYTLRTLALAEPQPSRALSKLNRALLREAEPERFCTLVFAVCRATDEGLTLRLCLAGHHPPMLRRSDGRVELVGQVGTALGLVAKPDLLDVSVHLHPGDLLCLFTDGLTEARTGDDLFGTERVAALLANAHTGPQSVLDALAGAVHGQDDGHPLADDLALLVLQATPRAPSLTPPPARMAPPRVETSG